VERPRLGDAFELARQQEAFVLAFVPPPLRPQSSGEIPPLGPAFVLGPPSLPAAPTRSRGSSVFPVEILAGPDAPERARRLAWSELLKRVWRRDVLVCAACGGAMHMVAFVHDPTVVGRILEHLGLAPRAPRAGPPPAGPPVALQTRLTLPNLDCIDPVSPED
jgi:hypothetical protein